MNIPGHGFGLPIDNLDKAILEQVKASLFKTITTLNCQLLVKLSSINAGDIPALVGGSLRHKRLDRCHEPTLKIFRCFDQKLIAPIHPSSPRDGAQNLLGVLGKVGIGGNDGLMNGKIHLSQPIMTRPGCTLISALKNENICNNGSLGPFVSRTGESNSPQEYPQF